MKEFAESKFWRACAVAFIAALFCLAFRGGKLEASAVAQPLGGYSSISEEITLLRDMAQTLRRIESQMPSYRGGSWGYQIGNTLEGIRRELQRSSSGGRR
jgi:hypothetical protein